MNTMLYRLAGICLLALVLGYTAGRLMDHAAAPVPGTAMVTDTRGHVATVQLDGIENGQLLGTVHGDVRFFLGGHPVPTDASGAIRVHAGPLLQNIIAVRVPAGMRFVASKKGTKYYAVDSAGGEAIVPENRLYFATEQDAEAAGYTR